MRLPGWRPDGEYLNHSELLRDRRLFLINVVGFDMSNLPRFIAAVAHITDFPLEVSEYTPNGIYVHGPLTLIASDDGLITVHHGDNMVYQLRVYGGNTIYHQTLKRSIKLDERNGKWYTVTQGKQGMAFHNLYDAMMHCGGTHGWV